MILFKTSLSKKPYWTPLDFLNDSKQCSSRLKKFFIAWGLFYLLHWIPLQLQALALLVSEKKNAFKKQSSIAFLHNGCSGFEWQSMWQQSAFIVWTFFLIFSSSKSSTFTSSRSVAWGLSSRIMNSIRLRTVIVFKTALHVMATGLRPYSTAFRKYTPHSLPLLEIFKYKKGLLTGKERYEKIIKSLDSFIFSTDRIKKMPTIFWIMVSRLS